MTDDYVPQVPENPPRWRQIELSLLDDIEKGVLKVGDRLPGEHTLAPLFAVTRTTVRRALAELQQKGVLRIERGRGVFVQRRLQYGLGPGSTFKANLRQSSLVPSVKILRRLEISASPEIAEKLRLSAGARLVVFDTVGEASGSVVSIARHHLPAALFPNAIGTVGTFSCVTEVYARFGFRSTQRRTSEISARLPTAEEARHLEQSRTEPVLEVRSLKTSRNNLPIDYTVARFSAARVSVFFDAGASPGAPQLQDAEGQVRGQDEEQSQYAWHSEPIAEHGRADGG